MYKYTSTSTITNIYWHSCGPKAEQLDKTRKGLQHVYNAINLRNEEIVVIWSCAQNILLNSDDCTSSKADSTSRGTSGVRRQTTAVSGDPSTEFTLQRIVHNRPELEHFRAFLADNFASDDLNCWLDIEELRHVSDRLRTARANHVIDKYFDQQYFYGTSSPANEQEQQKVRFSAMSWLLKQYRNESNDGLSNSFQSTLIEMNGCMEMHGCICICMLYFVFYILCLFGS